ncbi:MAG TPA: hypothetical protein PKD90_06535 [Phnomibacter sp.]|nr:hypothetical protein [Phnomibacter sp.]
MKLLYPPLFTCLVLAGTAQTQKETPTLNGRLALWPRVIIM